MVVRGLEILNAKQLNGPGFTWPLLMFASALPETLMSRLGRIYRGRPLAIKTRAELLAAIKPSHCQFLRPAIGDLPAGWTPGTSERRDVFMLVPSAG